MRSGGIDMALINCPECGKEVSDKAEVCMNCGYAIKQYVEKKNIMRNIICIIVLNVVLFIA